MEVHLRLKGLLKDFVLDMLSMFFNNVVVTKVVIFFNFIFFISRSLIYNSQTTAGFNVDRKMNISDDDSPF